MQLKEDDVKVLASLPRLQTFDFAKGELDHGWLQETLEVLFEVECLPDLRMDGALDGYRVLSK